MAQVAQPHLQVSSVYRNRRLLLAGLAALAAAATALALVIGLGSSNEPASIARTQSSGPRLDAGPVAGTPPAVTQAFLPERVPNIDAGPVHGTASAVRAALRDPASDRVWPPSLTTNVPAPPRADAGPAAGTPTAIRDAFSPR